LSVEGNCSGQAAGNADFAEKTLMPLIFFPFDFAQDRLESYQPLRAMRGLAKRYQRLNHH